MIYALVIAAGFATGWAAVVVAQRLRRRRRRRSARGDPFLTYLATINGRRWGSWAEVHRSQEAEPLSAQPTCAKHDPHPVQKERGKPCAQ